MVAAATYSLIPITRTGLAPGPGVRGAGAVRAIVPRLESRDAAPPQQPPVGFGASRVRYDDKGRIHGAQLLGKGFFVDLFT